MDPPQAKAGCVSFRTTTVRCGSLDPKRPAGRRYGPLTGRPVAVRASRPARRRAAARRPRSTWAPARACGPRRHRRRSRRRGAAAGAPEEQRAAAAAAAATSAAGPSARPGAADGIAGFGERHRLRRRGRRGFGAAAASASAPAGALGFGAAAHGLARQASAAAGIGLRRRGLAGFSACADHRLGCGPWGPGARRPAFSPGPCLASLLGGSLLAAAFLAVSSRSFSRRPSWRRLSSREFSSSRSSWRASSRSSLHRRQFLRLLFRFFAFFAFFDFLAMIVLPIVADDSRYTPGHSNAMSGGCSTHSAVHATRPPNHIRTAPCLSAPSAPVRRSPNRSTRSDARPEFPVPAAIWVMQPILPAAITSGAIFSI